MAKIKLLITDGLSNDGMDILNKSDLFDITFHKAIDKESLIKILPEYEAVAIRSATKMTKDLIDAGSKLKMIMRAGAGVDNVDVEHATKKNVLVFNCPGENNNAVAELSLGLMLGLLREIPRATAGMKANLWEKKELVGQELSGRTLGVIGFGAIGGIVGKSANALGMKVIAFDPNAEKLKQNKEYNFVQTWCSSIDDVFSTATMISLHIPLMEKTKNSIGKTQFDKLKDGSYFINCSRGGIVNEKDLLEALNNGKLSGAGLDVFEKEPVSKDDPLVMHPKVICTPHIGAATKEAQKKVGIAAGRYLVDYFKEGKTTTAVNNG
ncbi:MAG: hydroxyacid dehydrogenase [Oligoflexia bacterium]|nr:hydroxyacid dehydrogenase [Oligoflexia bacterium]